MFKKPIKLKHSQGIYPRNIPRDAPGTIYWAARKTFFLSEAPVDVKCLIVADRNYQVYVNRHLAVRNINNFNGNAYLFAQQWDLEITKLLQNGKNELLFIIRSDSFDCKNHQPFGAALWVEAEFCFSNKTTMQLNTDASWKTAMVDNWRKTLTIATTQLYEEITLPEKSLCLVDGVPGNLKWQKAALIQKTKNIPPFYLFTNRPETSKIRYPKEMVTSGECKLPVTQLSYDLLNTNNPDADFWTVTIEFDCNSASEIDIASTDLRNHYICLNGDKIGGNCLEPGEYMMELPPRLKKSAEGKTVTGHNKLELCIKRFSSSWNKIVFTCQGIALEKLTTWRIDSGKTFTPVVETLIPAQQLNAQLSIKASRDISIQMNPFNISTRANQFNTFGVIDFGELVSGLISFQIESECEQTIYLGTGTLWEEYSIDCARMNRNSVDILRIPKGISEYRGLEVRNFRFLEFLFKAPQAKLVITELRVEEVFFTELPDVKFESSDKLINRLWNASHRNAELCGKELYMDNPDREMTQWIDCSVPVIGAGYYCFGETGRPKFFFRELLYNQQPDGQLPGYCPGKWFPRTPLQCHMSLAAIGICQHYMYTGDKEFAQDAFPHLLKLIAFWEKHRNKSGLITDLNTVFVDWGSHIYSYSFGGKKQNIGALTTMNSYYVVVLKHMVQVAIFLGKKNDLNYLLDISQEVKQAINELLFDSSIGAYRDGKWNDLAEQNVSQTANLLAVWGDVPEVEQGQAILEKVFSKDFSIKVIPANAHFTYQTLSALFGADCDNIAFEWLKKFQPMLKSEHNTIWETFEPHASHCQGTGAALAWHLGRNIAGLYPLEPGFATAGLKPHLGNIKGLEAKFQLPCGGIELSFNKNKGEEIECRVKFDNKFNTLKLINSPNVKIENI